VPKLTVHPLTPERWPDFVRLFGERGVGGGCWCMGWRLPDRQQYLQQKGDSNREAMHALVRGGCVPGLLAYDGPEPIGWCAVAPREAYPALHPVPVKPGVTSTNYAFTGFVSAFEEAGFTECLRRSKTRPIMRFYTDRAHMRLKRSGARK